MSWGDKRSYLFLFAYVLLFPYMLWTNYFVLPIKMYPLEAIKKQISSVTDVIHIYNLSIKARLNIPPKLLLSRYNSASVLKPPISEGMFPVNLLDDIDKICSCLQLNKAEGSKPIKQLPFAIKY
jgi:hypothetical protein